MDFKNVKADTWTRTIVLVIALANQILAIFGKGTLAITDDEIYQMVSIAFTVISTIIAWWKNNSFTQAAQAGDEIMHNIKGEEQESGELTSEE